MASIAIRMMCDAFILESSDLALSSAGKHPGPAAGLNTFTRFL
jgi:hypothetical protein